MNHWAQKLDDAMAATGRIFTDVTTDLQNNALQATLVVDRDKAASLGITADVLRSTLYAGFGTQQVSTIYTPGDSYEVDHRVRSRRSTGRRSGWPAIRCGTASGSAGAARRLRPCRAHGRRRSPSTSSASCRR